jgi:prepilin-type N-terminal cleavage/methylation domain-containing protein
MGYLVGNWLFSCLWMVVMTGYYPVVFYRNLFMMKCKKTSCRAFSLVELAIVLVILGLLVGAILSGKSLIRASELRATIKDVLGFQTSVQSFREKYFMIPGDLSNASAFWGTWTPTGVPETTTGAKNGNGDGIITSSTGERINAFRHMALAGLIPGSYAGSYAEPTYSGIPGVNIPVSKLGGTSRVYINSTENLSPPKFFGLTGNFFQIQAFASPYTVVKPEEAWNVDQKIDDGIPSSGIVLAVDEDAVMGNRNCTTNDDYVNAATGSATYRLDVTTIECWMLFFFK